MTTGPRPAKIIFVCGSQKVTIWRRVEIFNDFPLLRELRFSEINRFAWENENINEKKIVRN